jgi:hypothetical protein
MSEAEFQAACAQAARKARNQEIDKAKDKYLAKIKRLQDRLAREERELAEDETEHSARKLEEMATHFENVLGLFGGSRSRRRVSSSLTKRRMTSKAKADIEESQETIVDLRRDLEALEAEMAEEVEDIETRWEEAVENVEEKVFTPYKKDVVKDLFGIAWLPYWQLARGEERFELPGFETRK